MTQHRRQPGYALLMTLVLLALTAVVFTAAARDSFQRALLAGRAQQALQRRWAAASCRAVLLPLAEQILQTSQTPTPSASAALPLALGGQTFQLLLCDEQAKLNVPNLEGWIGRSATETLLRQIVGIADGTTSVRLRHYQAASSDKALLAALASYDQLFQQVDPAELASPTGPAANVTCWGDGRLNYRRASNEALEALALRLAGPLAARHLTELRAENPQAELTDILAQLKVDEKRREKLELLLTEESACHSLWVVQYLPGGQTWHSLAVAEGNPEKPGSSTYTFLWQP